MALHLIAIRNTVENWMLLLALALMLLGGWAWWNATRNLGPWSPAETPLNLKSDEITSTSWEDYGKWVRHSVSIELRGIARDQESEALCLLGIKEAPQKNCADTDSVIDVEWLLFENGLEMRKGRDFGAPGQGMFWRLSIDGIERIWARRKIGEFDARLGRRFEVQMTSRLDGMQLDRFDPILLVHVDDIEYSYMKKILENTKYCAYLIIFVAILIFAMRIRIYFREKNRCRNV